MDYSLVKKYIPITIGVILTSCLGFLYFSQKNTSFETLNDFINITKELDEFIEPSEKDALFPRYRDYYEEKYAKNIFGKNVKGVISATDLNTKLKEAIKKNAVFYNKNYGIQLPINNESKIIVFGGIQGTFHSLCRRLELLKEKNIINDNLKLKPNTFIVFVGDAINRSPFMSETLMVILKLMKENNNNVIYLKGRSEEFGCDENHLFYDEVIANSIKEAPEIVTNTDYFFRSLPVVLLFNYMDNFFIEFFARLENQAIKDDLSSSINIGKNANYFFEDDEKSDDVFTPNVIIKSVKNRDDFELSKGLWQMQKIKGACQWAVFSSSNWSARTGLGFYYDSFSMIDYNNESNKWEITLLSRDIYSPKKDFSSDTFNLES